MTDPSREAHVHSGEWCVVCVDHGVELRAATEPAKIPAATSEHENVSSSTPAAVDGLRREVEAVCRLWFDELVDDRDPRLRQAMVKLRAALSASLEGKT